jgi:phosphoribosylamine-glycine ligase
LQVILPLLRSDLFDICFACTNGTLDTTPVEWASDRTACSVVLVSEGYPFEYAKGKVITGEYMIRLFLAMQCGLSDVPPPTSDSIVFHAGTTLINNQVVTNGGRVLCATAVAASLDDARIEALRIAKQIRFEGSRFRTDIGEKVAKSVDQY